MKFSNYKLVKKAEFQWDEGVFFGGKFMKNVFGDLWVLEAMRVESAFEHKKCLYRRIEGIVIFWGIGVAY